VFDCNIAFCFVLQQSIIEFNVVGNNFITITVRKQLNKREAEKLKKLG
jgi:hypothetical protein